jgi:hypothetical protein
MDAQNSVLEFDLAYTKAFTKHFIWTSSARALSVGATGHSFRAQTKLDFPIGNYTRSVEKAAVYLKLSAGADIYASKNLTGSAGQFGLRWATPGFIAELALKVTKSPVSLVSDAAYIGGQQ